MLFLLNLILSYLLVKVISLFVKFKWYVDVSYCEIQELELSSKLIKIYF